MYNMQGGMELLISPKVLKKLKDKHRVFYEEVEECFINGTFVFIEDIRDVHKTIPPTLWFISVTE